MLSKEELRKAYDEVDTDKSGAIELNELVALCGKLGEPTDLATVQSLFSEIDTNHDGKVSFQEFVAWIRLGKHTKLRGALKASVLASSWYNTNLRDKFLEKKGADMGETVNLVNVEITNGDPSDVNHVHYHVTTNADDEELVKILCGAFPDAGFESADGRLVAAVCHRSSNAAAYAEAMRKVLEAAQDMAMEMTPPEAHDFIPLMMPMCGHHEDWMVLAMNVAQNPMLAPMVVGMMGPLSEFPMDALQATVDLKMFGAGTMDSFLHIDDFAKANASGTGMIFNVNVSEAGKEFAVSMLEQFGAGMMPMMMNFGAPEDPVRLFDGVELKMRTNHGSNEAGMQEMADMMKAQMGGNMPMDMPMPDFNKFKNWEAAKAQLEPMVADKRAQIKEYTDCGVVVDLIAAMREHGTSEFRFNNLMGTLQAGVRFKLPGVGGVFDAFHNLMTG